MAARAATTVATRRNLQSLFHRFQASNCFFPDRTRGTESGKQLGNTNTRIYGALPKNIEMKPKFGVPPPPAAGCDPSDITSVSEIKCTPPPLYRLIDGLQRMSQYSLINGLQRSTADISPKLDIFINYLDEDHRQYFTGHSAEGGHISPAKYHIYPPLPDFYYTGNSCNGLLHFQNAEWENLVWNPTTGEFKIFRKTFDKLLPSGIAHDYFDSGMWCDPSYGYKVLQVVMASREDERGYFIDASFHIELYSSKSNSWKKIQCAEFGSLGMHGDCINGVFYNTAFRKEEEHSCILLFDFSTETFSTLPFPTDIRGSQRFDFLEYKGLFGFLDCWHTPKSRSWKFELWVLKEDRTWMRESVFHACGVRYPLWFSQNGELLYFASYDNELVVFDRATGKSKHLGIYFYAGDIEQLIPVRESFARLDRILDVEGQEKKEDEDVNETMDGPFEAIRRSIGVGVV